MPPNNPQDTNATPISQGVTPPDPNFQLGTEPKQIPVQTPKEEEVPKWAQEFTESMGKRLDKLEGALTSAGEDDGIAQAIDPNAPVGSTTPTMTKSELERLNPQTWGDLEDYMGKKINEGVQAGIEGYQKNQTVAQQQAEAENKRINDDFDKQVDELEKEGVLPPISNPNDRNDPGKIYRRSLYGLAAKQGTGNIKEVARLTAKPLHDQGKVYDPVSDSFIDYNLQNPGANAPIGASSTTTGLGSNLPSYKDIHSARNMDELRARAGL
jgi:hypothetical protein